MLNLVFFVMLLFLLVSLVSVCGVIVEINKLETD